MQIKIKLICRLEKAQNQGLISISTIKELKFFFTLYNYPSKFSHIKNSNPNDENLHLYCCDLIHAINVETFFCNVNDHSAVRIRVKECNLKISIL